MKLIKQFNSFETMIGVQNGLESIFEYVQSYRNTILASSEKDKSGKPKVRIDSKTPIKAVMIKFEDDYIEIKSIINSKGERGLFDRIMQVLISNLEPNVKIVVDQDVSGGFWDYQVKKYPQFHWIINKG